MAPAADARAPGCAAHSGAGQILRPESGQATADSDSDVMTLTRGPRVSPAPVDASCDGCPCGICLRPSLFPKLASWAMLMAAGVVGLVLFFYFWNRRRGPAGMVAPPAPRELSRAYDDAPPPPVR